MENRRSFLTLCIGAASLNSGCVRSGKNSAASPSPTGEQVIQALRDAYAAYNRGDIDAVMRILDPRIEWIEPPEYPDGGVYRGLEVVKAYLRQSRDSWGEGAFEPERFLPAGHKLVVPVHVRIRSKGSETWSESFTGDVWTFRNGRAVRMRAFPNREDALRWAGIAAKGS